jgi:hypothetical protein
MRRTARGLVQAGAVAGALLALASAPGCERPPEPVEDREIATAAMTEAEFVDHMAALTVAVGDGLTGEEARDRAAELGGAHYTREEIETFADLLRADPVKWAAIAERVDQRIAEIRSAESGGRDRVWATDESGEAGLVRVGETAGSGEPGTAPSGETRGSRGDAAGETGEPENGAP